MKIALGTVIYKGVDDSIIDDYIDTVNAQTDKDYDVLLINDGIDLDKIEFIGKRINRRVYVKKASRQKSIYMNRIDLLRYGKEKQYALMVFLDIDDMMHEQRISSYREQCEDGYSFYYNDLYTFDNKCVFSYLPQKIQLDDLLEENFVGLSTSAIRLNEIDDMFIESLCDGETNIFDWYLFSRMLIKGYKGRYVEEAYTYYRIYENNMAGICGETLEDLRKEVLIKKQHYKLLEKYSPIYSELLKKYDEIDVSKIIPTKSKYWWGKIKLHGGNSNEI